MEWHDIKKPTILTLAFCDNELTCSNVLLDLFCGHRQNLMGQFEFT